MLELEGVIVIGEVESGGAALFAGGVELGGDFLDHVSPAAFGGRQVREDDVGKAALFEIVDARESSSSDPCVTIWNRCAR